MKGMFGGHPGQEDALRDAADARQEQAIKSAVERGDMDRATNLQTEYKSQDQEPISLDGDDAAEEMSKQAEADARQQQAIIAAFERGDKDRARQLQEELKSSAQNEQPVARGDYSPKHYDESVLGAIEPVSIDTNSSEDEEKVA